MPLPLTDVVRRLAGLEEAILMKLADRCQFALNEMVYLPGKSGFTPMETLSLLELRLLHQEEVDAIFGRYLVAEERPFYSGLPRSKRDVFSDPELRLRDFETINLSGRILVSYLDLLHQVCQPGSDGHYGSAVEHDVICLQAIARRVHFAACYVAESKYQADPEGFQTLMDRQDSIGLLAKLTRSDVEKEVLQRVGKKLTAIQKASNPAHRYLLPVDIVTYFFKDWVIPLTKEGEVRYLLQRR